MSDINIKAMGLRIKALRRERGLSQTELAEQLGKSLRCVQKYEKGETDMSLSVVSDIARALSVSPACILGEDCGKEEVMAGVKLGERIRAIRKNAGCSQKEFCSQLGIPQSTLSAYETDRMQPTVATLIHIATEFNVSIDWICGLDDSLFNESDTPALPVAMPAKRVIKLTGKELTAELPADISPELLAILLDRVGK